MQQCPLALLQFEVSTDQHSSIAQIRFAAMLRDVEMQPCICRQQNPAIAEERKR